MDLLEKEGRRSYTGQQNNPQGTRRGSGFSSAKQNKRCSNTLLLPQAVYSAKHTHRECISLTNNQPVLLLFLFCTAAEGTAWVWRERAGPSPPSCGWRVWRVRRSGRAGSSAQPATALVRTQQHSTSLWKVSKSCTANEGPVRIQYKCLVLISVFPEMKLRGLVISKTEL